MKIAERVMQAGKMAQDQMILRRGARKMQDGTLGQKTDGAGEEDEPMDIRVGDDVHYHPQTTKSGNDKGSRIPGLGLLTLVALLGVMLGQVIMVATEHLRQPATEDTNTQYLLELVPNSEQEK